MAAWLRFALQVVRTCSILILDSFMMIFLIKQLKIASKLTILRNKFKNKLIKLKTNEKTMKNQYKANEKQMKNKRKKKEIINIKSKNIKLISRLLIMFIIFNCYFNKFYISGFLKPLFFVYFKPSLE